MDGFICGRHIVGNKPEPFYCAVRLSRIILSRPYQLYDAEILRYYVENRADEQ